MHILVIGSGGREHAIAWKLAQSSQTTRVFVAPGNAGTHFESKVENLNIDPLDFKALIEFARSNQIALTVVGPEAPLASGIVDAFQAADLLILGPNQSCAMLESSKAFSKQFMIEHDIPTAEAKTFTDLNAAKAYIAEKGTPIVIKADGLAAGKGVVIPQTQLEAFSILESMLEGNQFGEAGHRVVIESFLQGTEASYMVLTDGETILPLASSQDHKARDDGDKGPNTGGMGAFSPAPIITPQLEQTILKTVIQPVIDGFKAKGKRYTGFLYAGLMISPKGELNVLEFNCRLGDPETQPILMRLQSDFLEICLHAAQRTLQSSTAKWDTRAAIGVVLAAKGYPDVYAKGDILSSQLQEHFAENQKVFHAGTQVKDCQIITSGGRVICATALADSFKTAQTIAYELVKKVAWPNAYFRHDIGYRVVE
ncbi:MAG: phosphoribosylamine--glycine ligase [Gammaproteobacteria bacterium]